MFSASGGLSESINVTLKLKALVPGRGAVFVMSVPSSPLDRKAAIPHSPVVPSRPTTLQLQDYYPPNLSPLAAFASTPCTSLTPADAAVVLETALLWVRPDHSHAVVHAGALAMQNACARLLATDHGYLENLFSDANRLANTRDPTNFIRLKFTHY